LEFNYVMEVSLSRSILMVDYSDYIIISF